MMDWSLAQRRRTLSFAFASTEGPTLRKHLMLRILGSPKRVCGGWTRREMLHIGALGFFGLGLSDFLRLADLQAAPSCRLPKSFGRARVKLRPTRFAVDFPFPLLSPLTTDFASTMRSWKACSFNLARTRKPRLP